MTQERARQRNIHHLMPPNSEMDSEMSRVSRYQKYCVSDDSSHSGTMLMAVAVPFPSAAETVSSTVGQYDHGSVALDGKETSQHSLRLR